MYSIKTLEGSVHKFADGLTRGADDGLTLTAVVGVDVDPPPTFSTFEEISVSIGLVRAFQDMPRVTERVGDDGPL